MTKGPRGASISTSSGETVHAEAIPAMPLDTLGAGDAVIGTVLAGVLRGDDLEAVMSSAMSVAAQVCAHHGAFGHGTGRSRLGRPGPTPSPSPGARKAVEALPGMQCRVGEAADAIRDFSPSRGSDTACHLRPSWTPRVADLGSPARARASRPSRLPATS